MADYITKIRTASGDKQIDYNALANLPPAITVDSNLSSTSTNPVQNKVIQSALSGKAASSHNQAASTITEGTLAGKVVANATAVATISAAQTRNISAGTNDLTAGTSGLTTGDLYFVYE